MADTQELRNNHWVDVTELPVDKFHHLFLYEHKKMHRVHGASGDPKNAGTTTANSCPKQQQCRGTAPIAVAEPKSLVGLEAFLEEFKGIFKRYRGFYYAGYDEEYVLSEVEGGREDDSDDDHSSSSSKMF